MDAYIEVLKQLFVMQWLCIGLLVGFVIILGGLFVLFAVIFNLLVPKGAE